MCSVQNSQAATSETWPRAAVGYFLIAVAGVAIAFAGASEPPGILVIGLNIVLFPFTFASTIFFYGILWFYMASLFLGAITNVSSSVRIVGNACFMPAIIATFFFFLVLMARMVRFIAYQTDYDLIAQMVRYTDYDLERMSRRVLFCISLWVVVNVVRAAKRENSFDAVQVVVFVLWVLPIWWVRNNLQRFLFT